MVICLERGADLHMAQLIPLPLTVSCFSKIQIGLTFLVPAHPGSPGKRAVKRVCVCVCACVRACARVCSHLACEEECDESVRLLVSAGADATLLNQVMSSTSITLNSVTVDIHHRTTAGQPGYGKLVPKR